MVVTNLVFQYFFQIGSGIAAGIAAVIVPIYLIARFISRRKQGGID